MIRITFTIVADGASYEESLTCQSDGGEGLDKYPEAATRLLDMGKLAAQSLVMMASKIQSRAALNMQAPDPRKEAKP